MDLAQAVNACQPLALAGQVFPVRQLKLAEWGKLQAWLKSVHPSPVTLAYRSLQELRELRVPIAAETRDEVLNHAHELARAWPPPVGGREWLKALDQVDGGRARFAQAILQAGGTEVSIDEAKRLFDQASQEEASDLFRQAYYGDPPEKKGDRAGSMNSPIPTETAGMTSPGLLTTGA